MQKPILLEEISIRPEGKNRIVLFQFTGFKFVSLKVTKGMSVDEVLGATTDLDIEIFDKVVNYNDEDSLSIREKYKLKGNKIEITTEPEERYNDNQEK